MKKQALLFTILILLASILFAQNEIPEHQVNQLNGIEYFQHNKFEDKKNNYVLEKRNADLIRQQLHYDRGIDDLIWVVDSTYNYDGNVMDWQLESRSRTLSRNEYGNLTTRITDFYNETSGQWLNKYKTNISYHDGQVYDEYLRQAWNSETESWVETYYDKQDEKWNWLEYYYKQWDFENNVVTYGYRSVFTYNEKGENTKGLRQILNLESNYWENEYQDLFTYNIDGLRDSRVEQWWDIYVNDWKNNQKTVWAYNPDGTTEYLIEMVWNNEWINETKILYNYDEHENNIEKLEQIWETEANEWGAIIWKWTYTYDVNNNMSESLKQSYDVQNDVYNNETKATYTYDTYGNQTLSLYQTWDGQTNHWINISRSIREFDNNGNRTLYLYQSWSIESNSWTNEWQYIYSYDENGLQILNIDQDWNNDIGQWVNSYKYERFWSQIEVSDISENSQFSIKIYPNPSSGFINITTSINEAIEISIFDIHGRNLISKEISENNNQIDLSQLLKGIYFIRVNDSETHKIILK